MLPIVLQPLVVVLVLAALVTATHRRLPPVVAARTVTASVAIVAAAAAPTMWILSLGYIAHLPLLDGRLDWCAKTLGVHDPIPSWVGLPALLLTVAGAIRVRAVLRRYRRLRHDHIGPVEIADHAQPFALPFPGEEAMSCFQAASSECSTKPSERS